MKFHVSERVVIIICSLIIVGYVGLNIFSMHINAEMIKLKILELLNGQ